MEQGAEALRPLMDDTVAAVRLLLDAGVQGITDGIGSIAGVTPEQGRQLQMNRTPEEGDLPRSSTNVSCTSTKGKEEASVINGHYIIPCPSRDRTNARNGPQMETPFYL